MAVSIELWQVYYLFCNHTKPLPKYKFVVIACIDDTPMGFLINSKINQFIYRRPKLLVCEVKLEQIDHDFLSYNSYLDCRDIFPFETSELTDLRGTIHDSAKGSILTAVSACPVLPTRYKQMIIEANNP